MMARKKKHLLAQACIIIFLSNFIDGSAVKHKWVQTVTAVSLLLCFPERLGKTPVTCLYVSVSVCNGVTDVFL